jgi:hypothetical protein
LFGKDNSIIYDGYWLEDLQHGEATRTYSDGQKYIGEFVKGKREGTGKLLTKDNFVIYEG